MVEFKVRFEGLDELTEQLEDEDFISGPLLEMLQSSATVVERRAKEIVTEEATDTGLLKSSIRQKVHRTFAEVFTNIKHAIFVEKGSRPHWPPPGALQPWARRHGFPAGARGDWLARRAIAQRGTEAVKFMERALKGSRKDIRRFIQKMLRDIAGN